MSLQPGRYAVQLTSVRIHKPDDVNVIVGQSHFIKTVEDVHEALVNSVPTIRFGLAFCEASGACLVRWSGNDEELLVLAREAALSLSAGHVFVVFLRNAYPVNVLNAIKMVPEVCRIFCATANPLEVILAETPQGRGVLGVVDGAKSKGVEDEAGIAWRKGFVRTIGYKL
jgi:adenosine/AMP kinase